MSKGSRKKKMAIHRVDRPFVLGLDVGATTIGWAIYWVDEAGHPIRLGRIGVRRFGDARHSRSHESLASVRRVARQRRRQLKRRRQRRQALMAALQEGGLLPLDLQQSMSLARLDPYYLRDRALSTPLDAGSIGRAIYHLGRLRGQSDMRKVVGRDAGGGAGESVEADGAATTKKARGKPKKNTSASDTANDTARKKKLLDDAIARGRQVVDPNDPSKADTWGQYLWEQRKENAGAVLRMRESALVSGVALAATRAMILEEFDMIWDRQRALHEQALVAKQGDADACVFHRRVLSLLSETEMRVQIRHLIEGQRPLRPVPCAECTLIPGQERARRGHPLAEEFDVLSRLADVRVPQRLAEPRRLAQDERDACLAIIQKKGTLEWDAVRGITGDALPGVSFTMQKSLPKGISGMRATRALMKVLGPEYASWSVEVQASVVKTLAVAQSARQVREELETVMPIALTDPQWRALSGLMLPSGFGGLSLEALRRIVPLMRARADLDYAHATEAAGIGSHSLLHPADDDLLDELPYYGSVLRRYTQPLTGFVSATLSGMAAEEVRYGRIGNPTVHVGLNELRKLVNAILRRYGRPSAIVVETARDFGLSGVKLTEHLRMQKKNEKYWERARAEWQALLGGNAGEADFPGGAQDLSGRLEKYLLWREMPASDRVCIYSGRPIGLADLIAGSDLEVDHILPESLTLDNSWDNKVLCFRSENQRKKQRDPYDAFGPHRGDPAAWEAIRQRLQLMVDKEKGMPFPGPWGTGVWKRRMAKFQEGATEQFLKDRPLERRLLNATSYFSTVAREYLSHIVPNRAILASNGRMTAMLRREFGLKKDRSTHHHHAVDAALTACLVDRSWITKLQRLWKSREESGGRLPANHDRAKLEYPYTEFRRELVTAAERVVISERPEHGVEGEIHKATMHKLTDAMLRQRFLNGEAIARIPPSANSRNSALYTIKNKHRALPQFVESGGNAYCDIYRRDDAKWIDHVVPLVDALRGNATDRSMGHHVMRLFNGDTMLIEENGAHRLVRVVKMSKGDIVLRDLMTATNEGGFRCSANTLRLAKARKVTVDMLGFVHDRGFVA